MDLLGQSRTFPAQVTAYLVPHAAEPPREGDFLLAGHRKTKKKVNMSKDFVRKVIQPHTYGQSRLISHFSFLSALSETHPAP